MKQVLATGIVRAPHGVKGFVRVKPYSDDFKHFFSLKEVTLQREGKSRKVEIEQVQNHSGELLVKFKGIDSPEDARFISGWDILVPRQQASKLGKGEVYIADLPGMKLVYENEEVGEVVSTIEGAQALLLEVLALDGKKYLVPYMKGIFVSDVDLEKGTIKLLKKELLG
jgi:16S rRNA processing protein RimM